MGGSLTRSERGPAPLYAEDGTPQNIETAKQGAEDSANAIILMPLSLRGASFSYEIDSIAADTEKEVTCMHNGERLPLVLRLLRKAGKAPAGADLSANAFGEGAFEVCVLCKKVTEIPRELPVQQRRGYVEGHGQLCESCYRALYGPPAAPERPPRLP